MRSAWAGGLHLRSRADERRGAGVEVNTFRQSALIHDGYERRMRCYSRLRRDANEGWSVEALLVSTGVIALAELGDKTQLLALLLAARFRAPLPVIAGIVTAVLINHLLAGVVGTLLAALISPVLLRWLLVASFIATAVWMLIPDKQPSGAERPPRYGAYVTTVLTFFLVEMGDKTQIATVALAAKYQALVPVVAGTTLGMLIADVPAVLLGRVVAERIPLQLVHRVAACVFVALALLALAGVRA
jgi:Ca2+/H+ antiporter, TMEM165/GDT1 family